MSSRFLFIAGTDTGVGKTVVTTLLALHLRQQGFRVVVCKPFASGCEESAEGLISEDAEFLRSRLNLSESVDEICPIRLLEPLAPLVAARRAQVSTARWFETVTSTLENLASRYDLVLVEGVGGLVVPVGEEPEVWTCERLIQHFEMDVVLVARRTLGTINHSWLTTSRPNINFRGLIFNDAAPVDETDIAAQSSPAIVAELTGLPIWAQIPAVKNTEAATLERVAASFEFGWPNN